MKEITELLQNAKDAAKRFFIKLKQNKDLFIYLVFFFIATALWFLNALRKEYVTTITYPVKYSNLPNDYILKESTEKNLELKIRAQGYSLLPYHIGKINAPIYLSVSNFNIRKAGNTEQAFILSREYLNAVSSRLANNIELLEIFPDTLSVTLEEKLRKLVPVVHQSSFSCALGYNVSDSVITEPKLIEVSGPASVIDTISYVNLVAKDYSELKDSIIEIFQIQSMAHVLANPKEVSLIAPVEAFTEKKISIPVLPINLPDSLQLRTFPSNINLICRVPVSKFAEIDEMLFHAVVDYGSYNGVGLPERLKVRLLRAPAGIKNLSYSPLFVECLFEKK